MDMNKSRDSNKACKTKRSRRPPGGGTKSFEKDTGGMKVVYISTPMKVKTCASKFRAIVQELTGRESDVVGIMDSCGGTDTWMVSDHHHGGHNNANGLLSSHELDNQDRRRLSPLSSEDLVDDYSFDGALGGNHGFGGAFDNSSSNYLYDQFCYQLDVLGNS